VTRCREKFRSRETNIHNGKDTMHGQPDAWHIDVGARDVAVGASGRGAEADRPEEDVKG